MVYSVLINESMLERSYASIIANDSFTKASAVPERAYALFIPAAVTDSINGAVITPILVAAYASAAKGRARRL